jgi:hypothetical protein
LDVAPLDGIIRANGKSRPFPLGLNDAILARKGGHIRFVLAQNIKCSG